MRRKIIPGDGDEEKCESAKGKEGSKSRERVDLTAREEKQTVSTVQEGLGCPIHEGTSTQKQHSSVRWSV